MRKSRGDGKVIAGVRRLMQIKKMTRAEKSFVSGYETFVAGAETFAFVAGAVALLGLALIIAGLVRSK